MTKAKQGMARPFLEAVARAYAGHYSDLSEFCFVFPNKRAGTFFLKYLGEARKTRTLAPEVIAISDFVARVADHDVASRIDLLFRLYNIYRNNPDFSADEKAYKDFDAFRNWGETLLSDFSEVDQYLVDADALFSNVRNFKEIRANYLSDEQIRLIEKYFGYAPPRSEVDNFWAHLATESPLKNQFLYLWQQMGPLYHALNESLEKEQLCTSGGAYRLALERLKEHGREILPWKKIVIVGFNALSTAEAAIFELLQQLPADEDIDGDYAEFYWDGTGPVLGGENGKQQGDPHTVSDGIGRDREVGRSEAMAFLRYNRKNFPSPEWAEEELAATETDEMPPRMRVIAAPSNTAQAKIAGTIAGEWVDTIGVDRIEDARAAIVLPDEGLLMPLLYSLPEETEKGNKLESINLTMGYPLKSTSVISFIHHLRRLHTTARVRGEEIKFYHEDLRIFLSHPYVHAMIGSAGVSAIKGWLNKHHKIMVSGEELAEQNPELGAMLKPLRNDSPVAETISYIEELLKKASVALDKAEHTMLVKSKLDRDHIETYRNALHQLEDACREHGVEMSVQGVFAMADKLLAGENTSFEGTPLKGLQVMGLLETRALDFERLMILSLNDSIMPRKASARTFIPDALRHGYGLPFSNYREELFSYYFYRMISRAKEVILIYDARASEGMRSGGMSRYLMQLKYLHAPDSIRWEKWKYKTANHPAPLAAPVPKTEDIMNQLKPYLKKDSEKKLSASVLKNYLVCPVKFYYQNVGGLRPDEESSEFMDEIAQGNVIHDVMLYLYFPKGKRKVYLTGQPGLEPEVMTEARIDAMIKDTDHIDKLIRESINRKYYNNSKDSTADTGSVPFEDEATEMLAREYRDRIIEILEYDKSIAPFTLIGGEITRTVTLPLSGNRRVNMTYSIDRLDRVRTAVGERYRVVDYKTGAPHVEAKSHEAMFNGDSESINFFQLMLYANMVHTDLRLPDEEGVKMSIYGLTDLPRHGETIPKIGRANGKRTQKELVRDHLEENEEFYSRLQQTMEDIFDPEKPFEAANDDTKCKYCQWQYLCGRSK